LFTFDIDLITAANGWSMAFTGAMIVLTGLSVLSFIISQLPKLLALMEGTGNNDPKSKNNQQNNEIVNMKFLFSDIDEAVKLYEPLVQDMEQPFQLSQLYEISEQNGLPHTHLTVKMLREAGRLVPAGDGAFTWKN